MQDYFKFFDLDQRFFIDKKALRVQFISNSRAYHPDFFTLDDDSKQEEVLRLSTLNNEAYKVLSDDRKRMQHLLALYEMFPEEGKAQVPQEFLMEMMDVNEQLMEAQMSEDGDAIANVVTSLEGMNDSLAKESELAMSHWDANQELEKLSEIRDIYLKQQYLRRLKDRLESTEPGI